MMDISNGDFYYFSAELELSGLPTKCEYIKSLKNEKKRESILIRCENKIREFGGEFIVVVPRNPTESLLNSSSYEDVIFLFTFEASAIEGDSIDLNKARPIDVGGIVKDKAVLSEWVR